MMKNLIKKNVRPFFNLLTGRIFRYLVYFNYTEAKAGGGMHIKNQYFYITLCDKLE